MGDCKPCDSPGHIGVEFSKDGVVCQKDDDNKPFQGEHRGLIGCLTYFSNCTRPDVCFAANKLAASNENPK